MVEDAQGYDSGQQDADRAHLVEDEGNVHEKEFQRQADRFPLFDEIVVFLSEIDQQIDDYQGSHDGDNVPDELADNIRVESLHG